MFRVPDPRVSSTSADGAEEVAVSPSATMTPQDVTRRIGATNERALAYALAPDPALQRLSARVVEDLLPDLPPVTAGALLGPAGLARHFVASAAQGRYRDLLWLWRLFRDRPDECRPVLAERQRALQRARGKLETAAKLCLRGHAELLAADVDEAEGLIWQWLRETLHAALPLVGARPAIADALLLREPELDVPLPAEPDERWLAEAAAARRRRPLVPPLEQLLAKGADRLPASITTLTMVAESFPGQLPTLVDRIDLEDPGIQALLAWVRDHGLSDRLHARIQQTVEARATDDRSAALATWFTWRERGVDVTLPAPVLDAGLEGLDLGRPDVAALAAALVARGDDVDMQAAIAELAGRNRQLAEKAYEALVCAGLDVVLPAALEGNPLVKQGTRCPWCQAWTFVRAGHERRCPRRPSEDAGIGTGVDEWSAARASEQRGETAPQTASDPLPVPPEAAAPTDPGQPDSPSDDPDVGGGPVDGDDETSQDPSSAPLLR